MTDLTVALLSLIIGVAATLAVGHYYFRRTVSKELSVYLQSSAQLFRGVAHEVRQQLNIEYRGVPVEHLQEVQFLIANTGERAIRDVIKPLSSTLPGDCALLDAALVHVTPKEREIRLTTTERSLQIDFPLLNRDEFFVLRLLVRGRFKSEDLTFQITADDLPPALKPSWSAPDLIKSDEKRSFEYSALIASAAFGVTGWACALLVYNTWVSLPQSSEGFLATLLHPSNVAAAALVACIPTLVFIVVAVMLFFGSFTDFSFPPRRRFVVPKDVLRFHRPLFVERGSYAIVHEEALKKG